MPISNPIPPISQDEGVELARVQTLDFVGAGVTGSYDSSNSRVVFTIPGAGAPGAHQETHVAGGSDAIGSYLPFAAIPTISAGMVGTGFLAIGQVPSSARIVGLSVVFDGGGTLIGSGSKIDLEIPFPCTIMRATLLGDITGSVSINWKAAAYGSYPTLAVIGSLGISNGLANQAEVLPGWTTAIADGDILEAYVLAQTSGLTKVTASLKLRKD